MLLVGRNKALSSENYRFGFNGYENTDDIYGNDLAIDFGARVYDSRLGRFYSIDPLDFYFSYQSGYCFAGNCPVKYIDYYGNGPIDPSTWTRVSTVYMNRKNIYFYSNFDASEVYSYTAFDKWLFWYGRIEQSTDFRHPIENLADEIEIKERYSSYKIKPGDEYVNREGIITERYNLIWEEQSGWAKELAATTGNYDYRTNTKNGFSITQVEDGIITYVANYKKGSDGLYYIASSTSFIIEKVETDKTMIMEGQEFTYVQVDYNIIEINYNSETNEASQKSYTHSEAKPGSIIWVNPNPVNLEKLETKNN